MAKLSLATGTTSYIAQVFIQDSSSTTGAGLTGLTNASGSLTAYFHRDTDTTATAISLVTMTVGTFTSSGFKEIDATNMPGWYQFCPPNTALASGAKSVAIHLKGATNMAPLPLEIELTAVNNQSANGFMTGVNSIAPPTNWNLDSIDASGRRDISKILGTAISTPATAGVLDVNVKNMNNVAATSITTINANQGTTQPINFTGTGASALAKSDMVDIAGAAVSATTAQIGANMVQVNGQVASAAAGVTFPASIASPTNITAGTITTVTNLTNAPTAGDLTATMKTSVTTAATAATPALSAAGVQAIWDALTSALTTVGSIGKRIADFLTGDAYVRLGAPAGASTSADIAAAKADTAAIKAKTDSLTFTVAGMADANVVDWKGATAPAMTGDAFARIGAAGAGLTALGDTRIANLDATVSSRLAAAVITLTGGQVSIDAASKTGLRLSATGVGDILTTALTESYAADGAAPTVSQALFQIQQFLQERAIASTTMTVKKLDGSTTAMTFTLDSASSPTTITRAT